MTLGSQTAAGSPARKPQMLWTVRNTEMIMLTNCYKLWETGFSWELQGCGAYMLHFS